MVLVNSPSAQSKLGSYSLQSQQLCLDGIILVGLVMCTTVDLSIAAKKKAKKWLDFISVKILHTYSIVSSLSVRVLLLLTILLLVLRLLLVVLLVVLLLWLLGCLCSGLSFLNLVSIYDSLQILVQILHFLHAELTLARHCEECLKTLFKLEVADLSQVLVSVYLGEGLDFCRWNDSMWILAGVGYRDWLEDLVH